MLLLLAIGGMLTNTLPSFAVAAERKEGFISEQKNRGDSAFSPTGFRGILAQTYSSMFVMKLYTEKIQRQSETDLGSIRTIDDKLRENIVSHQKSAKKHATYWIEDLHPQILKVNQSIINFNELFQNYYVRLSASIKQKNKEQLQSDLEELSEFITNNIRESDLLTKAIQQFRSNIHLDVRNFKEDSSNLTPILTNENSKVTVVQQQITQWNDKIKKLKNQLLRGETICFPLLGCLTGKPLITAVNKEISSAENEIHKLQSRLVGGEKEVAILTDVQNKIVNMVEAIDMALGALQHVSNQWYTIQVKYETVLEDIQNIDPEDLSFIRLDLNTAKKEWQDMKEYAEKLLELYLTTD